DDDKAKAIHRATQLYRERREEADAGAVASWEHCFDEVTEISAVQHAYNILIDTTEDAFMAECQNTPIRDTGGLEMLTPESICRKQSPYEREIVPPECT